MDRLKYLRQDLELLDYTLFNLVFERLLLSASAIIYKDDIYDRERESFLQNRFTGMFFEEFFKEFFNRIFLESKTLQKKNLVLCYMENSTARNLILPALISLLGDKKLTKLFNNNFIALTYNREEADLEFVFKPEDMALKFSLNFVILTNIGRFREQGLGRELMIPDFLLSFFQRTNVKTKEQIIEDIFLKAKTSSGLKFIYKLKEGLGV